MAKGSRLALSGPSHHKHHLELCGTHCLAQTHSLELRGQLSCSLPDLHGTGLVKTAGLQIRAESVLGTESERDADTDA